MKTVILCLIVFLFLTATAVCQTPVPTAPAPGLTERHKRDILNYLDELKGLRTEVELIQRFIARDAEQDKAEQEIATKRLQLAERELDLVKQQADHYKDLYETLSKRRTVGCKVKMVLSLGIARCR